MRTRDVWRATGAAIVITMLGATPTVAEGSVEDPTEQAAPTADAGTPAGDAGTPQPEPADAADAATAESVEHESTSSPTAAGDDDAPAGDPSDPAGSGTDPSGQESGSGTEPAPESEPAPDSGSVPPTTAVEDDEGEASVPSATTIEPDPGSPESSIAPGESEQAPTTAPDTTAVPASTNGSSSSSSSSSSAPSTSGGSSDEQPAVTHDVESTVEITSVQIAVADTGNNTSTVTDTSPQSGGTNSTTTALTTGAASAVGSEDSTTLVQQAITELTDDATAEIVQIAITFNIGAAVANSGTNTITAGPGSGGAGGAITTGNATSIGNDSATYLTQGAAASAGAGESTASQQTTMVLHLGVAISNTGANTIVASVSGAGSSTVSTGDASAVGNQSTTEVGQLAYAAGSGDAQLTIEQRATIVNLGLALADSGSNAIGGALSTAIESGSTADFERLLALILPELLAAAASADAAAELDSAPSGSAATGDAVAIGNRSITATEQVAVAAADGGMVFIGQDIVVVNAGVASATTGGNAIGGSVPALDPDAQAVVTQLAGFLSGLLARIDAWSAGGEIELGSDSLSASLGELSIGLDSSLSANSAPSTGTSATIRQLTAVINLAFALANTGHNSVSNTLIAATTGSAPTATLTAASVSTDGIAAQAAGAGHVAIIITGDATATNTSVVIVCDLGGGLDVPCLGPESEPPGEPPTPPQPPIRPLAPQPGGTIPTQPVDPITTPEPIEDPGVERAPLRAPSTGLLAATGGDPRMISSIATLFLLCGTVAVLATRRPRPVGRATSR